MANTIFITGTSSGIGEATVLFFQKKGWNVVASMRDTTKKTAFSDLENVLVVAVDVTKPATIAAAITKGIEKFGSIDVFVNNAGFGVVGPFEGAKDEDIKKELETNILGVMHGTKAILPYFREQKKGTVINIASMGGKFTFPLYSVYHASKWAVEGFSESLQHELVPLNIKIKIIEPGTIKTNFYRTSAILTDVPKEYEAYVKRILPYMQISGVHGSDPSVVAQCIYTAATDGSWKLRYNAGRNAAVGLFLRKILPESVFIRCLRFAIWHNLSF